MITFVFITAERIMFWLTDKAVDELWMPNGNPIIESSATIYTGPFPTHKTGY